MMELLRPKIAVVAGGNSGEYEVSLKSAANIMANIDRERFDPYLIVMIGGDWFCEIGGERLEVNRGDFSLPINGVPLKFDLVFNIMHGTPGEDGILQGYFDLLGIPVTSSGRLTSALTFNKYFCSRFVSALQCVNLTDVVVVRDGSDIVVDDILAITSLPCFVKPNQGGSSLGMSKVKTADELIPAVEKAFGEDDTVLVEAFIGGTEVTCGVFRKDGQIVVLPLTEIVPKTEYFDYAAKYLGESEEITPARIPIEEETEIKRISALLFQYLECKGFVRFDYILSPHGLYFLEVNTVPGMSNASIIPQMLAYHGMSMQEFLSAVIQEAL